MNSIDEMVISLQRRIAFYTQAIESEAQLDDVEFNYLFEHEKEQLITILNFVESFLTDKSSNNSLYITPKDLEGLPQELINQLGLSESDKQDFFLMEVIEDLGGLASIDKIMIQAYKKNRKILDRQKLSAKLYRMLSKKLIYSLPNKKGIYSLKPVTVEEEKDMEN